MRLIALDNHRVHTQTKRNDFLVGPLCSSPQPPIGNAGKPQILTFWNVFWDSALHGRCEAMHSLKMMPEHVEKNSTIDNAILVMIILYMCSNAKRRTAGRKFCCRIIMKCDLLCAKQLADARKNQGHWQKVSGQSLENLPHRRKTPVCDLLCTG